MEAHEEEHIMEDILERVSGVLQECRNGDNSSVAQLDVLSFNMRSCSVELGELIHEMMFSHPYDENQLQWTLGYPDPIGLAPFRIIEYLDNRKIGHTH